MAGAAGVGVADAVGADGASAAGVDVADAVGAGDTGAAGVGVVDAAEAGVTEASVAESSGTVIVPWSIVILPSTE